MKRLLTAILILSGFFSYGQTVGYFRYDTSRFMKQGGVTTIQVRGSADVDSLLAAGKYKFKSSGEYNTSFTIPSTTASITLDTIAADRTVTFTSGSSTDVGVTIYVYNSNVSDYTWNVSGTVKESADGSSVTFIPRGLHVFQWTGSAWFRQSTGTGSGTIPDTSVYITPLYKQDDTVRIDLGLLPYDTVGTVLRGDTLYDFIYPATGSRDSVARVWGATTTRTGFVTTGEQSFAGFKIFTEDSIEMLNRAIKFKRVYAGAGLYRAGVTVDNNVHGDYPGFTIATELHTYGGIIDYSGVFLSDSASGIEWAGEQKTANRPALNTEVNPHGSLRWNSDSLRFEQGYDIGGGDVWKGIATTDMMGGGSFSSPMTTNGDLITQVAGVADRLGIGTAGQVLTVSGGLPAWSSATAANIYVSSPLYWDTDTLKTSTSAAGATGNVQYKGAAGGLQAEAAYNYDSLNNLLTVDTIRSKRGQFGNTPFIATDRANDNLTVESSSASGTIYPLNVRQSGVVQWGVSGLGNTSQTLGAIFNAGTANRVDITNSGQLGFLTSGGSIRAGTITAGALTFGNSTATWGASATLTSSTFGQNIAYPWAPVSGSGIGGILTMTGTYNQTGGTMDVCGIYYNPTITAVIGKHYAYKSTSGIFSMRSVDLDEASTTTTTDATVTTIVTIPLATSATECEIDYSVRAKISTTDFAMYHKIARFKNVGGTLTQLGSTNTIGTDFEDAALSTCDVTITVSGTNILIQATGVAATTIVWKPVYKIIRY